MIAFCHGPLPEDEAASFRSALFEIGCRIGLPFTVIDDHGDIPADALMVRYGPDAVVPNPGGSVAVALPYAAAGSAILHTGDKPLWGTATSSGIDVVRGVAELLSAKTEASVPDAVRSSWGGFEAEHHPLQRDGVVMQPLVEYAAEHVRMQIVAAGHNLPASAAPWGAGKRYVAALTHDVDGPQCQTLFALTRSAYYALRQGNEREREALELGLLTRLLGRPDPYWNFADWTELERQVGLRSTYYFYIDKAGTAGRHFNDPRYDVRHGAFPQMLRELHAAGNELGIHYGICAHGIEHYRAAADQLRAIVGTDFRVGGRAHYWSIDWRNPQRSWQELEAAGYGHDSSVSPMAMGFRFGSAQCTMPTRLANPATAQSIVVVPTAIMDAYVAEPRPGTRLDQRLAEMDAVIDRIARVGGVAVFDWHERTLANRGPWRGYMLPLLHALDRIRGDSAASFMTMAEIRDAWAGHVARCYVAPAGGAR